MTVFEKNFVFLAPSEGPLFSELQCSYSAVTDEHDHKASNLSGALTHIPIDVDRIPETSSSYSEWTENMSIN
jgi:hypothetical protein